MRYTDSGLEISTIRKENRMPDKIYVNDKVGIVAEGYPNAVAYYSEEYVNKMLCEHIEASAGTSEGGDHGREG